MIVSDYIFIFILYNIIFFVALVLDLMEQFIHETVESQNVYKM